MSSVKKRGIWFTCLIICRVAQAKKIRTAEKSKCFALEDPTGAGAVCVVSAFIPVEPTDADKIIFAGLQTGRQIKTICVSATG